MVVEYLIRRFHREKCSDPVELLASGSATDASPAFATAYSQCETTLSVIRASSVFVMAGVTLLEGWCARCVYRYARMLMRVAEAREAGRRPVEGGVAVVEAKEGWE